MLFSFYQLKTFRWSTITIWQHQNVFLTLRLKSLSSVIYHHASFEISSTTTIRSVCRFNQIYERFLNSCLFPRFCEKHHYYCFLEESRLRSRRLRCSSDKWTSFCHNIVTTAVTLPVRIKKSNTT